MHIFAALMFHIAERLRSCSSGRIRRLEVPTLTDTLNLAQPSLTLIGRQQELAPHWLARVFREPESASSLFLTAASLNPSGFDPGL